MKKESSGIQLPDDARLVGYRDARPFHYDAVYYSEVHKFTGTEREFIAAGIGYEYYESDYRRVIIQ